MKNILRKIFVLGVSLFGVMDVFSQSPPPPPGPGGGGLPPPPPGTPIDDNILFLIITAVFFGIYIIYKNQYKTKAPIV